MTRNRMLMLVGRMAVGLACIAVYAGAFRRGEALQGSGTVEARDVRVGSKVGGRVSTVRVREGDTVLAGQVLVTFDEQELLAGLRQARANLEKVERGSRPEEVAEARAAAAQARADYELHRNGSRKEDIEAARAEVDRTRVDAAHAERNFRRVADPAVADVISKQQRDDAETAWKMAVAAQRNAEQKLAELERGYRPEEITSAEARYRQAEATLLKLERGNRREDIEYAQAELLNAGARYRERQVVAPSNAMVEVLDVLPGDLVAPNTPIATLLERDQVYIRIYVPETKIGQVRIGQRAEVRVDSFPKEVFQAEVGQINQEAEFLPRNVETKEERVHQVFGVKLRIHDPTGRVRAGLAADVKLNPQEHDMPDTSSHSAAILAHGLTRRFGDFPFLTFMPSIFFSGYIFPLDTMPLPFYILSCFVPASYYINITRGTILRGAGTANLWPDGLILLGMGMGLMLIAAKRFQKKVIAV